MHLLLWSLTPLIVGPLLYEWAKQRRYFLGVVDGFIFVAISSLLGLHFIEGLRPGLSLYAFIFLLLGFLGPNYLERRLERGAETVHKFSIFVGVAGLIVHAALDGAGLVVGHEHHGGHHLPIAIILHRIPVGLMLWWLLAPVVRRSTLVLIFILMALATIAGWATSVQLLAGLSAEVRVALESFVAGSILHVVFFKVHLSQSGASKVHDCCAHHSVQEPSKSYAIPDAIGNLLAIVFMAILITSDHDLVESLAQPTAVFLQLALQSAPALLAAYVLAGFLYAFLPQASYDWLGKGARMIQALKGVLFGLPLPICSCGVLPFYKSLIDRGVAKTAAIAFLVATPELGLDAVLISIPLLGSEFTVWRLIAAFLVAYIVAIILGSGSSSSKLSVVTPKQEKSVVEKLKLGWRYGFCDLVDSTGPWILLGLFVAALLQPVLDGMPLAFEYQLDVLLFAVIGIFVYVCAAGATPLVAILLSAGLSPGAGLAFLLTGPATNVSTFGILSTLHGRRFAFSFGILVTLLACSLGVLVNLTVGQEFSLSTLEGHLHAPSFIQQVSLLAVALLLLFALIRRGARRFCGEIFGGAVHGVVETG